MVYNVFVTIIIPLKFYKNGMGCYFLQLVATQLSQAASLPRWCWHMACEQVNSPLSRFLRISSLRFRWCLSPTLATGSLVQASSCRTTGADIRKWSGRGRHFRLWHRYSSCWSLADLEQGQEWAQVDVFQRPYLGLFRPRYGPKWCNHQINSSVKENNL